MTPSAGPTLNFVAPEPDGEEAEAEVDDGPGRGDDEAEGEVGHGEGLVEDDGAGDLGGDGGGEGEGDDAEGVGHGDERPQDAGEQHEGEDDGHAHLDHLWREERVAFESSVIKRIIFIYKAVQQILHRK